MQCARAFVTLTFLLFAVLPAPAAPQAAKPFVLVPYAEPQSSDPFAAGVSDDLTKGLTAQGVPFKTIDPIYHLEAVATAAKLCADNDARGLLVPEGRYQQTVKRTFAPFVGTITKYPTHADFRLDVVGCDGTVRWSTTASNEQSRTGVSGIGLNNLGSVVDAAFRSAVADATRSLSTATLPEDSPAAAPAAAPPIASGVPAAASVTYLLVPVEQPGMADPSAPDITHSMLVRLQQRKLDVKAGMPIDHLTAVADAQKLCSASGTQAIVVPSVRIEQSSYSGRSHAQLVVTSLSCAGKILARGVAESDIGHHSITNFSASAVDVAERAMDPALDMLFPSTVSH
jgi:hypothetical protein